MSPRPSLKLGPSCFEQTLVEIVDLKRDTAIFTEFQVRYCNFH